MTNDLGWARRFVAAVGLATVLGAAITACSDDSSDNLPPPASPDGVPAPTTPAETLDPRDAEAWEEIQTLFDGFMETWIKWAAEGSPGGFENPSTAELNQYADAFLLSEIRVELSNELQDGRVRSDRPEWEEPRLLTMDWEGEIPEAVFEVCVDDSDWIVVDAETGEPVAADTGGTRMWTMTARWSEEVEFGPEGWALVQREIDEERSC